MSLPRDGVQPVPVETARVAHAAFPDGNVYLRLRDELGTLFDDELFTAVYAIEGQPALHPWQLALVSVMQFMENLSDRQAAQAVRARIDWKYALGLELTDEGFHYSVLSEFRTRLVQRQSRTGSCWTPCSSGVKNGAGSKPAAASAPTRRMCWGRSRRSTSSNWSVRPCGMRSTCWRPSPPSGSSRRSRRSGLSATPSASRTTAYPKTRPNATRSARPLARTATSCSPVLTRPSPQPEWAWLKELPAVRILEQTWAQQYRQVDGHAQRLTPKEMVPVSEWYRSPYDEEVRYGRKRDFDWIGYKVHLTECCDDDLPHLITQVETAPATQQDHHALKAIQAELADKPLLPQQHLVDAGYISAKRILESRDRHAIDLIGPVHVDPSWQAHTPGAFDVSQFPIDWDHQVVTCPQGEQSIAWHRGKDAKGESVVHGLVCSSQPARPVRSGRSAPKRRRPGGA